MARLFSCAIVIWVKNDEEATQTTVSILAVLASEVFMSLKLVKSMGAIKI